MDPLPQQSQLLSHPRSGSATQPQPHPIPSATLSIFDPTLSTRTRLLALTSSLTINFLLPFINGVMLGFGEIFAKGVVGWFRTGSWTVGTGFGSGGGAGIGGGMGDGRGRMSATAVGVGAVGRERREEMMGRR